MGIPRASIALQAPADNTGQMPEEAKNVPDVSAEGSRQAKPIRVLMAAGGTGGHIFPALAVAKELVAGACARDREEASHNILFLGTERGLESRLIPAAGFALRTVTAAGLKGIRGWHRWQNLFVLPQSAIGSLQLLRSFRPDVVVGMGGYLAGPAMLEAALMGIPTLLIEPNAVPGLTNRILAPVVRGAAVGFECAAGFYGNKARVTGHAVRQAFFDVPPKLHAAPFTVLVMGGSQGAHAINECAVACAAILLSRGVSLNMVHQTGERDYNKVREEYARRGLDAEICAFIDDVPSAFGRADVIVSRAGASAVAELAAAGKAAVLIPFPGATDQHQRENAAILDRAGAACMIEQRNLTPERLASKLGELLGDAGRLSQMERKARSLARPGAAKRIADWVAELAGK